MKKVLPKVKRIINMSLKQAKFYGDDLVSIEHIIISLINDSQGFSGIASPKQPQSVTLLK